MGGRGYLIRFIDIGLIVMFGFIQISDIVEVMPVDLAPPAAAASGTQAPAVRRVLVVRVGADGAFTVEAGGRAVAAGLTGVGDLEAAMRAAAAAAPGEEVVVVIRPHEASAVQRTVDVMDICDRLGVRRSLDTEFERTGGGA